MGTQDPPLGVQELVVRASQKSCNTWIIVGGVEAGCNTILPALEVIRSLPRIDSRYVSPSYRPESLRPAQLVNTPRGENTRECFLDRP